jgi:hypothetical protein
VAHVVLACAAIAGCGERAVQSTQPPTVFVDTVDPSAPPPEELPVKPGAGAASRRRAGSGQRTVCVKEVRRAHLRLEILLAPDESRALCVLEVSNRGASPLILRGGRGALRWSISVAPGGIGIEVPRDKVAIRPGSSSRFSRRYPEDRGAAWWPEIRKLEHLSVSTTMEGDDGEVDLANVRADHDTHHLVVECAAE